MEGIPLSCFFSPQAQPYAVTPVDNLFLAEYMPRASGFQAQVYLYGLMLCQHPAMGGGAQDIAAALRATQEDVLDAFLYWQGQGLVQIKSKEPLEVEYLCLRMQGYRQTAQVPGQYYELVQALQRAFAPRALHAADLKHVYDWIEVYGLEEGAVLALTEHCLALKGNQAGVKYMDTVARSWADAGVHTREEALAYMEEYYALTGGAAMVLKRWRMRRQPTQDELELYEKWVKDWGFTQEAVLAACPAVTSANTPSFKYLDGVLSRLRQEGSREAGQVQGELEKDRVQADFAREVFAQLGLGGSGTPGQRQSLFAFLEEGGMPRAVVLLAAQQAASKRDPFTYLKRLLANWQRQGVDTSEKAREEIRHKAQPQAGAAQKREALEYPQRQYSEEELQHVYVNLDEE